MTRKRRMFDIKMPERVEAPAAPTAPEAPTPATRRRGPMASAITENDALAHEYVALKSAGHVVEPVPLDEVHTNMLVHRQRAWRAAALRGTRRWQRRGRTR